MRPAAQALAPEAVLLPSCWLRSPQARAHTALRKFQIVVRCVMILFTLKSFLVLRLEHVHCPDRRTSGSHMRFGIRTFYPFTIRSL